MKRNCLQWIHTFAIWVFLIPTAHAVQFSAHVDKIKATLEDHFMLTLVIRGVTNYNLPRNLTIPHFRVSFHNQSSQSQWVNGKGSTQMSYRYALFPLRTGKLSIPAFSTSVKGKKYHTEPIQLEISKASAVPLEKKPAFVRHSLSVQRSYPNQQILYTFELYIRKGLKVANIRFEQPDFSAFHVKELENQPNPVDRNIGGQLFETYTVRYALSPQKQGKLQISPATLHGERVIQQHLNTFFKNSFFGGQRKPFQLRTASLNLEVLPFPTKNRPQSFYGLVGNYAIQASLSQSEIKTGDSATLKITIAGPGRAESIQKPSLVLDQAIKIYEEPPAYQNGFKDNQPVGKAIFTIAIVPSQAKIHTFPPIAVTFFNPQSQAFETRHANIPPLKVIPGEKEPLKTVGGNFFSSQKQNVVRLGEDLLPIHQDIAVLQRTKSSSSWLLTYGLLFLLGPLCFGMGFFWKWKSEHSVANRDKIRRSHAFSKFRKELKEIHAHIPENQSFSQALMVVLKNYIGDKANKYGEALTSQEIGVWLTNKQVDEALVTQLRTLLEQCEKAQYAAGSLSEEGKEEIYQSGQDLIQRLEEQLK